MGVVSKLIDKQDGVQGVGWSLGCRCGVGLEVGLGLGLGLGFRLGLRITSLGLRDKVGGREKMPLDSGLGLN